MNLKPCIKKINNELLIPRRFRIHLNNTIYDPFNFLEVKSHIFNFLPRLAIQHTTSQKIIFNTFWEVKILSLSKSTFFLKQSLLLLCIQTQNNLFMNYFSKLWLFTQSGLNIYSISNIYIKYFQGCPCYKLVD